MLRFHQRKRSSLWQICELVVAREAMKKSVLLADSDAFLVHATLAGQGAELWTPSPLVPAPPPLDNAVSVFSVHKFAAFTGSIAFHCDDSLCPDASDWTYTTLYPD